MTPQELELERAMRMLAQKIDRLRASRERLQKAKRGLDAAMMNVEHDLILCLAAAEDIQDDKESSIQWLIRE